MSICIESQQCVIKRKRDYIEWVWSTTDMRMKLADWHFVLCVWWELELRNLCNIYGMNLYGYIRSGERMRMNGFVCVHDSFHARCVHINGNFGRKFCTHHNIILLFFPVCLLSHFVCLSIFQLNLTHSESVDFRIWYRIIHQKCDLQRIEPPVKSPYRIHYIACIRNWYSQAHRHTLTRTSFVCEVKDVCAYFEN